MYNTLPRERTHCSNIHSVEWLMWTVYMDGISVLPVTQCIYSWRFVHPFLIHQHHFANRAFGWFQPISIFADIGNSWLLLLLKHKVINCEVQSAVISFSLFPIHLDHIAWNERISFALRASVCVCVPSFRARLNTSYTPVSIKKVSSLLWGHKSKRA